MIHVEGLRFRYPGAEADAIDNLSLDIASGSLFGLLGPNGSGKTTLISLLSGLLTAREGRIGIASRQMPAERRSIQAMISLVPQEYAFYPRLAVLENLRFFAGAQKLDATEQPIRINNAIDATGLGGFENKRAERLSGGLKRRLNLAIGLLNEPRILFLDEPTVGIDPQSRHFILEAIRRINGNGTTIVYTSHYMEEVEALCDEIAILDQGRLIARGDLQSLLGQGESGPLIIALNDSPKAGLRDALNEIAGLTINGATITMPHCTNTQLQTILSLLAAHRAKVARIRYGYADLEDLFLRMTGHGLRD